MKHEIQIESEPLVIKRFQATGVCFICCQPFEENEWPATVPKLNADGEPEAHVQAHAKCAERCDYL